MKMMLAIACLLAVSCTLPMRRMGTTYDPATDARVLEGDEVAQSRLEGPHVRYRMLAGVPNTPTGDVSVRLAVEWHGTKWMFLESTTDADGVALPTSHAAAIDQKLWGATVVEALSIQMTREYLSAHVARGLDITTSGVGGDVHLRIPSSYLTKFAAALDAQSPAFSASR